MTTVQDILEPTHLEIGLSGSSPADVAADALIVGVTGEDVDLGPLSSPDAHRALSELARLLDASGAADAVTVAPAPSGVAAALVAFVGLGTWDDDAARAGNLRLAAGAATRRLTGTAHSVVSALPASTTAEVRAVAEGLGLGGYTYTAQKSRTLEKHSHRVESATVCVPQETLEDSRHALDLALETVRSVHLARTLVNLSPDTATPEFIADVAETAARDTGVTVEVLAEEELTAGSFGGLLGVGRGSANTPRLVKLQWAPARAQRHVALVGKGITFDSGGLSLKPPASMMTMKSDMAGAAAVLATVLAAARLELPVTVTGWLCLAENMPSGTATRPGDVITMHSGHTVEVLNTDAEGRLVLGDGLWAAGQENPDLLVDIATLTGAQMVALGTRTAGVMGDPGARDAVLAAASDVGEAAWAMPLPDHLRPSLDSTVADLKNIGDKHGGMLVAALFLREFVPEAEGSRVPWAHVDIAGPSFNEGGAWGHTPKGATGFGVRTLLATVEKHAS